LLGDFNLGIFSSGEGIGMVLSRSQIAARNLVFNAKPAGWRDTSYDATVGRIITEGNVLDVAHFMLPKRGIIWVVSHEEFHLPDDVTGLATLRTSWSHDGILALNVGVIDPGYEGPLSTALINFSDKDFIVRVGDPFFRVIFNRHRRTGAAKSKTGADEYTRRTADKSARTSNTFLNMRSLSRDVIDEMLTFPRWTYNITKWGTIIAFAALLLAIIAVFLPVTYGISSEWATRKEQVDQLRKDVDTLKQENSRLSGELEKAPAPPVPDKSVAVPRP
jgi:deoxycytidine triphosphate deaminase